jgi:hypothetical protein
MKTTLSIFLASLFIILVAQFQSNAQNSSFKCTYEPDSHTQEISKQILEKMNFQGRANAKSRTTALTGVVKIPLVVHVIEPSTSSSLITNAEIAAMVANLNASYRATGAFAGSTDIEVEFELAKQDPTCAVTTGITRYDASGNATYVSKGVFGTGVSWATVQGWRTWDKKLYTNVWIVNKLDNGAAGVGGPGDGLIVLASAAKTANEQVSPHEMAHYFGLAHPFLNDPTPGTQTNCNCGDGDGLADTPLLTNFAIGSTCQHEYLCTSAAKNSINPCTNAPYGDIQNNIMNYLNSACGTKFTPNQKTFMRNFIEINFATLLTSPVLQTTPITPAAVLTTPTSFCTASSAFPNIGASCLCSTPTAFTINGTSYLGGNPNIKPTLLAGGQSTFTYILTCANGTTSTKTVNFYNPGLSGITTACGAGNVYTITYPNPNNYIVTASAGTVSGNSVINIPSGTNVTLTVSDANGCGGNQQVVQSPCCSLGSSPNACTPTATNGIGNFFGITRFALNGTPAINSLSSSSGSDGSVYVDKSCNTQTTVVGGNSYTLTVGGFFTNTHQVKVYIDYNNNGLFTDANENVASGTTSGSTGGNLFTTTIVIPQTAVQNTLLRVRVLADASSQSNSCNIVGQAGFGSGQIEDYALKLESVITSVASGNWETPATWDLVRIPNASDKVIINDNHHVTVTTNTAVAKKIEYKTNAKIIFATPPVTKISLGF